MATRCILWQRTNNVLVRDFVPVHNSITNSNGLYDKIKGNTYEEFLGIYYQEETDGAVDQSTVNKTVKRVITYKNYPSGS